MKVQDFITRTVYSMKDHQTLNDAAQLMWEHDCGWLPVLDDNDKVIAAITDRDIAMAAFFNGTNLFEIPVAKAQSQTLVSCRPEDDLCDVEEIMQAHQVRRVPVIDGDGQLIGVVSLNDIALAYQAGNKDVRAEALSGTLAQICNHTHSAKPVAAVA